AGGVGAVEAGVELAGDEGLQRAAVLAELVAPGLERRQDAFAVLEHQLARGGFLRAGERRQQRGREQQQDGKGLADGHGGLHGGHSPAGAVASSSLPPPLNMYLPTICIRSTAGVV